MKIDRPSLNGTRNMREKEKEPNFTTGIIRWLVENLMWLYIAVHRRKKKKNTRDEREGFFFTGRIITFNQFLEGERRVVRSGFRMTNLIWRKGSWDGEGGILGTFLRFVFFFLLLRTQQIMDFFRTQLTNWLLATNKKKTTKHCIRYFYRGRQNEEAHFGHTKTKLFFSICLFHSFHLPDDWLPKKL